MPLSLREKMEKKLKRDMIRKIIELSGNTKTIIFFSEQETQLPFIYDVSKEIKPFVDKIYLVPIWINEIYLAKKIFSNKLIDGVIITPLSINALRLALNNRKKLIKLKKYAFNKFEELPLPNYKLIINKEEIPPFAYGWIEMGAGCPYKCIFCIEPQKKFVRKTPHRFIFEVLSIIKECGTREFIFDVPSFLYPPSWSLDICKAIKKKVPPIVWRTQVNAIHVKEKLVKSMKESGCVSVSFGVESGSPKILKYIKKPLTLNDARKAVKIFKKYGIMVGVPFIFGFPTEDIHDAEKSYKFIKKLILLDHLDYFALDRIVPRLSTPLFNQLTKEHRKKIIKTLRENGEYISFLENREENFKNIYSYLYSLSARKWKVTRRKFFLKREYIIAKMKEKLYHNIWQLKSKF
jgi:radical SAM superfamily enzyme YgiQ (UPF0313 family)